MLRLLSQFNPKSDQYHACSHFKDLNFSEKCWTILGTVVGALAGLPLLIIGSTFTGVASFRALTSYFIKKHSSQDDPTSKKTEETFQNVICTNRSDASNEEKIDTFLSKIKPKLEEERAKKIKNEIINEKKLNLYELGIEEIPEEIKDLTDLETLILCSNEFEVLPPEIFDLKSLKHLNISSNFLKKIPQEIKKLENLETLKVASCEIKKIPEAISELENLKVLNFSNNKIKIIPESIQKLKRLESLNLSRNEISEFPESIGELKKLENIDVSTNKIEIFPNPLIKIKKIKSLSLKNNNIKEIPKKICELEELENLQISGNKLNKIPESFMQLKNLKQLNLRRNRISEIPDSKEIFDLKKLEDLDVGDNNLVKLPKSFCEIENLKNLSIKNNKFTEIPEVVCSFKDLEDLDVSLNEIKELPLKVLELKKLKAINIEGTRIIHFEKEASEYVEKFKIKKDINKNRIRDLFDKLVDLKILEKHEVKKAVSIIESKKKLDLSGREIEMIPDEVWGLISGIELDGLYLHNNRIKKFPEELLELSSLKELKLNGNEIEKIPDEINRLKNLKKVDFSSNKIKNMPANFKELKKIEVLLLDNNEIQTFPAEILSLSELKNLQISKNKIDCLPDNFNLLKNIIKLDVSHNKIKRLPKKIDELVNIKNIFIGSNELDCFPEEILSFINLETIDLSNNQINKIPDGIDRLKNLYELSISKNKINSIPPKIERLNKLALLDLGINKFTEIPPQIFNCHSLRGLFLLGNQIQKIPKELSKLENLHTLSLSDNKIQSLPKTIGKMKGLIYLDLSGNQLRFVPAEIKNLTLLGKFIFTENPLNTITTQEGLGKLALKKHFKEKIIIDPSEMNNKLTLEHVYWNLDNDLERVDRRKLKQTKLPQIPETDIENGEQFLEKFNDVWNRFNFENEADPLYLSYPLLGNDDSRTDTQKSNKEKIEEKVRPRLLRFFKKLYDLPLEEGENKIWMMYDEQKPALRKSLNYIMSELANMESPVGPFIQLVHGLYHCPTGQKEAVDATVQAIMGYPVRASLDALVEQMVAVNKHKAFRTAMGEMIGNNTQNVHLISTYERQLKEELGLSNVIDFEERMGVLGHDPFQSNKANVAKIYFEKVTPKTLTRWVLDMVSTLDDLKIIDEGYTLRGKKREENKRKQAENKRRRPIHPGMVMNYWNERGVDLSKHEEWFTGPIDEIETTLTEEGARQLMIDLGYIRVVHDRVVIPL